MTGGNEGVVYILTPTNPPKVIAKIQNSGSEITSVSWSLNCNGIFILKTCI